MTITHHTLQLQTNISQSLRYFLKYQEYYRSGASMYSNDTLDGNFTNLDIILGYPDSLEKINLPCLAIEEGDVASANDITFGTDKKDLTFSYSIWGFYGNEQTEGLNRKKKNELANDVKQLLEETEYMYYHEYPNFNSGADMEISNVNLNNLPITGTTPADRHRFVVSLDLIYVKN